MKLVVDLPEATSGSEGKVAIANGFTWKRYWVRFKNGKVIGHINHEHLVKAKHYERYVAALKRENDEKETQANKKTDDTATGTNTMKTQEDNATVVNGITIPAYLLERSATARARLGA